MKKVLLTTLVAMVLLGACTKQDTPATTPTPPPSPLFTAEINTDPITFTGSATLTATRLIIVGTTTTYTITIKDNLPVSVGNTGVNIGNDTNGTCATVQIASTGMYTSESGTLYISSYNTTTKQVSGTFNFSADQGGFNAISIGDGSYENIAIK